MYEIFYICTCQPDTMQVHQYFSDFAICVAVLIIFLRMDIRIHTVIKKTKDRKVTPLPVSVCKLQRTGCTTPHKIIFYIPFPVIYTFNVSSFSTILSSKSGVLCSLIVIVFISSICTSVLLMFTCVQTMSLALFTLTRTSSAAVQRTFANTKC